MIRQKDVTLPYCIGSMATNYNEFDCLRIPKYND